MELQILKIGEYAQKEEFLQHITELVQIGLTTTDSYMDLFEKLGKLFNEEGEQEKKDAVNDFIAYNKEINSIEELNEVITEDENMYAVFNLRK